ncbi:MAG: hypothetical protein MI725_15905 [Pirellulales bacterium]|nr:hypothetical protein [Pirellulales bacterium]
MSVFSSTSLWRGPVLICAGLLLVVLAQFWSGCPVVTAMAVVAWGAMRTLHAEPRTHRQDLLSIVNLTIYSSLVCLAIVAQSYAVMQRSSELVSLAMLLDHAAAIVLVLGLAAHVTRRLSQPLAEER